MGRFRSKDGCVTCKSRRKKCDEAKPVCTSCARLKLKCSFDPRLPPLRSATELGTLELTSPVTIAQWLVPVPTSPATEEGILRRIPVTSLEFFTPACGFKISSLRTIWQLMRNDELVQATLLACFSTSYGNRPDRRELNRCCYVKSLRLLRHRLSLPNLTRVEMFKIQIATQFLGLFDTMSSDMANDPLRHWMSLATMHANSQPFDDSDLSLAEHSVWLLHIEGLVYHSALAMFCRDPFSVRRLLQKAQVFETLTKLNPDGNELTKHSPFICGQYHTYELIIELTCLHRSLKQKPPDALTIVSLEAKVHCLQAHAEASIRPSIARTACSKEHEDAMMNVCQLHNVALLILVKALREQTFELAQEIDIAFRAGLDIMTKVANISMSYVATVWPLNILTLAARDDGNLQELYHQANSIRAWLDPGHRGRTEHLVEAVRELFAGSDVLRASISKGTSASQEPRISKKLILLENLMRDTDHLLPPGLLLLREPHGVLS